jgi:uncharacterized protein (TIGR03492 family)
LLFISNGHGEDSIAAQIVRRLPAGYYVAAYPTLGDGRAYAGVCPIVGPRRSLPSEGHRVRGSLWRDALAGFGIGPSMGFMRREAKNYDAILVVGDLLGVVMCWLSGNRVRIYLDVYKSGFDNSYSGLERWLIGSTCDLVLNRDAKLARQLPNGRFAGNVMMDTLVTGPYDAAAHRRQPRAIAILPGSRESMRENFAVQLAALRLVSDIEDVDLFVALARPEDAAALASAAGLTLGGDLMSDGTLQFNVSSGSLGAVLAASDLVLGQGGTANLQALGLGRPVVTFLAEGTTASRAARNAALTGDSRVVVERDPAAIAGALQQLLADAADRARRGAIGRERMGGPGAIDAIIEELAVGTPSPAQRGKVAP